MNRATRVVAFRSSPPLQPMSAPTRWACIAGLLLGAGALAGSAEAQTPAPSVYLGPLSRYGPGLAAQGIVPNATYLGEFADNPSGGAKQGADYAGQLAIGADVDLEKLAGLQGGGLHVEFTDRQGRDLATDTINNSVSVQQIYGGGQSYYLTTLTYEQKLFNGVLDLLAGRTELDQVALTDPIYCQFQSNAFCGQPDLMGKIISASFYPVPIWGGRALIAPTAATYFSAGVFDSDPADSEAEHHGFDMGLSGSRGVLFPFEAGYGTSFANDKYPRRYDIGVVVDRTPYSFTTYDASSRTLGTTGAYGRTMVYGQAKQMVFRPDAESQRGLTMFGAVVVGPGPNETANYNITAGGVYLGPFASRPLDSIGVAIGVTHYTNAFVNQLYDYRAGVLGGTQRPSNSLIMGEVHYDVRLTPWIDIMPNLQYIIHPDGLGTAPYPKSNLPNAFVVGLQFKIDLAVLGGLLPSI